MFAARFADKVIAVPLIELTVAPTGITPLLVATKRPAPAVMPDALDTVITGCPDAATTEMVGMDAVSWPNRSELIVEPEAGVSFPVTVTLLPLAHVSAV
jgi:hypothetical protein